MADQDDYLYDRYNTPDPSPINQEHQTIAAWTTNPTLPAAPQSDDQAQATTTALADSARTQATTDTIANPNMSVPDKVAAIQGHSADMGNPDTSTATVGLGQKLASDGNEQPPAYLASHADWLNRQTQGINNGIQSFQDAIEGVKTQAGINDPYGRSPLPMLTAAASAIQTGFETGSPTKAMEAFNTASASDVASDIANIKQLASGDVYSAAKAYAAHIGYAAWALSDMALKFVPGVAATQTAQLASIVQSAIPDFHLTDFANGAAFQNEFHRVYVNMPVDEQEKVVPALLSAIGKTYDGPYAKIEAMQSIQSMLSADPKGWGTNVLAALNFLPVGLGETGRALGSLANDAATAAKAATGVALDLGGKLNQVGKVVGDTGEFHSAGDIIANAQANRQLAQTPLEVYQQKVQDNLKETYGKQYRGSTITRTDSGFESTTEIGPKPNNGYATEEFAQNLSASKYPGSKVVERGGQYYIHQIDQHDLASLIPEMPLSPITYGPKIAVGTPADAATSTTIGAKQAVQALTQPTAAATLIARGTTPEQVAGSLVLPDFSPRLDALGKPFVNPAWYNDEMGASVLARVQQGLGDVLTIDPRNVTLGELTPNGFKMTARWGGSDGHGLDAAADAHALGNEQMGQHPFEVIRDTATGKHFVQARFDAAPGLGDVAATSAPLTKWNTLVTRLFGRESAYSQYFNRGLTAGERTTNLALGEANKAYRPYAALWAGGKRIVDNLLQDGDRAGKWFTRVELANRGVTDPKIVHAYYEATRLAEMDHAMANFNAREEMSARGFKEFDDGKAKSITMPKDEIPKAGSHVVDMATGKTTTHVLGAGDKAFEFMDRRGGVDGYTHGIVRKGDSVNLNELPGTVIPPRPGYLLRKNQFPYYVRNLTDQKMEFGANSPGEAQASVQRLRQQNPDKSYTTLRASEIDSNARAVEANDITRLKNQGLFYTNHRGPDILNGVDDEPRLMEPGDALKAMITRYARNAGVERFVTKTMDELNARVAPYGVNLKLGSDMPAGRIGAEGEAAIKEAKRIKGHLEMMSGMSKWQMLPFINEAKEAVYDTLYNASAHGIPLVPGSKAVPRFLADNLSGMSSTLQKASKSAAFFGYLGTQLTRGPFLHTGMIPTYFGLKGVTRYVISGAFHVDLAGLTKGILSETRPAGDAGKLYDLWRASGMQQGIENHLLVSQSIMDSGGKFSGHMDDVLGGGLRALKRYGFDAPITLNKMSAMLAAVKRFRSLNDGKWPTSETDIDTVTHDTEALGLQMNRTDPLPSQNGMLGAATQFMGYHIKAAGRVMMLDHNWTPTERASMAMWTMATYGLDGLKMGALIEAWEAKEQVSLPDNVKELIKQGVAGTLFNTAIGMATQSDVEMKQWGDGLMEGKRTLHLADYSGGIGPFNFVGPDINVLTKWLGFHVSSAQDHAFMPAVLGMAGAIKDIATFGWLIGGSTDLPYDLKGQAMMIDAARKFPLSTDIIKAHAISRNGFSVDNKGNPVLKATSNEVISSLLGFQTYEEEQVRNAQARLLGTYHEVDSDALTGALRDQADKNAPMLAEALHNLGDGTQTAYQVAEILQQHAMMYGQSNLLSEHDQRLYFHYISQYLRGKETPLNERVVSNYINQMRNGKVTLNSALDDELARQNYPGVETVRQYMKNQADLSAFSGKLLGDDDGR